jgi:hypothetical protein
MNTNNNDFEQILALFSIILFVILFLYLSGCSIPAKYTKTEQFNENIRIKGNNPVLIEQYFEDDNGKLLFTSTIKISQNIKE